MEALVAVTDAARVAWERAVVAWVVVAWARVASVRVVAVASAMVVVVAVVTLAREAVVQRRTCYM